DAAHGDLEMMARGVARRTRELRLASAELAAARDQAVRALQLREEFICIASHELRTPLTSLKLIAQMAKRAPDPQVVLERLEPQVTRLAQLVEEMLHFSGLQSGQLSIERAPADLSRVVGAVVEGLGDHAADAGVEIRF